MAPSQRKLGLTAGGNPYASLHGARLRQSEADILAPPQDSSDEEGAVDKTPDTNQGTKRKTQHGRRTISLPNGNEHIKRWKKSSEIDQLPLGWGEERLPGKSKKFNKPTATYSRKPAFNLPNIHLADNAPKLKNTRVVQNGKKAAQVTFKPPPPMVETNNSETKEEDDVPMRKPKFVTSAHDSAKRRSLRNRGTPEETTPAASDALTHGGNVRMNGDGEVSTSQSTEQSRARRRQVRRASQDVNVTEPTSSAAVNSAFHRLGIDATQTLERHTSPAATREENRSTTSIIASSQSSSRSAAPISSSEAYCPLCRDVVDKTWLEEISGSRRLSLRRQAEVCKAHKLKSAHDAWRDRRYPEIDWADFDTRLRKYHFRIEELLHDSKTSYYRRALQSSLMSGKNRTLKQTMLGGDTIEGLSPGYYGPRGARIMTDNVMTRFTPKLRRMGGSDKIISAAGVSGYVQAVLAPELAVLVVMDDMNTDEDGARKILRDSASIGNLLNEDEDAPP